MKVKLAHVGNPDIQNNNGYRAPPVDPGRPRWVEVDSLPEAVEVCRKFIETNELGNGNWTGGDVKTKSGKLIAYVSYNGRIWASSGFGVEELSGVALKLCRNVQIFLPKTCGNQHGLHCPKCGSSRELQVSVYQLVKLVRDGTEEQYGDTEWDDTSYASCSEAGCGWQGKVKQLKLLPIDDSTLEYEAPDAT